MKLYNRDDWTRYHAAMKALASRFGTTVNVYQKNNRLSVNFDISKLSQEDADAVSEIENLIELVSELPENYLVTHEPAADL